MAQTPPKRVEASDSKSSEPATFIFLHGFGDDADGWVNIAEQFQSASKLPYLSWLFPNAPHNHEAMSTAWYTPSAFSPIPVGRSSGDAVKEESGDEDGEDHEDEILKSVEYVCGLIDGEVERGVQLNRIVIGGFSQGCAVSLVTALASRYGGKIAAVVGLSGYLPKGKKIKQGMQGYQLPEDGKGDGRMQVFLAHGTKDTIVPMRLYRDCKERVSKIVGEELIDSHEYDGMGHVTCGPEFRHMCEFLEKVIPA